MERTKETPETVVLNSGNALDEIAFGADAQNLPRLLSRLSDDLYAEKGKSAVRELVSNAIDSGASKVTISFDDLTDELAISDNGCGMSYRTITDVYSQFGATSKHDALDEIGDYGLGAKAPLAVADTFTVDTNNGKERTVVVVSKDADGIVGKVILHEANATTPRGTKVSLLVQKDLYGVKGAIASYRKYRSTFPTGLEFDLKHYLTYDKPKEYVSIYENPSYKIWVEIPEAHKVNTERLFSMFRLVSQKDWGILIGGYLYENPTLTTSALFENSLLVEVKPGVLDFSLSREAVVDNFRFSKLGTEIEQNWGKIISTPEAISAIKKMLPEGYPAVAFEETRMHKVSSRGSIDCTVNIPQGWRNNFSELNFPDKNGVIVFEEKFTLVHQTATSTNALIRNLDYVNICKPQISYNGKIVVCADKEEMHKAAYEATKARRVLTTYYKSLFADTVYFATKGNLPKNAKKIQFADFSKMIEKAKELAKTEKTQKKNNKGSLFGIQVTLEYSNPLDVLTAEAGSLFSTKLSKFGTDFEKTVIKTGNLKITMEGKWVSTPEKGIWNLDSRYIYNTDLSQIFLTSSMYNREFVTELPILIHSYKEITTAIMRDILAQNVCKVFDYPKRWVSNPTITQFMATHTVYTGDIVSAQAFEILAKENPEFSKQMNEVLDEINGDSDKSEYEFEHIFPEEMGIVLKKSHQTSGKYVSLNSPFCYRGSKEARISKHSPLNYYHMRQSYNAVKGLGDEEKLKKFCAAIQDLQDIFY